MVPWLVNRQGIDLQQAADDFGVSVEQLEADLDLLFLCGYGQLPDELIEADWEEGRVFVGNADTIARPLRLGRRRGPGPDRRAARAARGPGPGRARRRRAGAGQARGCRRRGRGCRPAGCVAEVADGASPELLALAQQAIADHRRVHLRYLVPAPRRGHRARRRPDAGGRHGRQLVPRGLVPPRRGRPDVPVGPDRGAHRARRRRHPAGGGPRARPVRGHLPAGPRRPAWSPCGCCPGPPGSPTTTRWSRRRTCRRPRVAACWCGCAPPTRPGCAGWCGGSGAGARCSTRRRWSPRCVRVLVPPWRPTPASGTGA